MSYCSARNQLEACARARDCGQGYGVDVTVGVDADSDSTLIDDKLRVWYPSF
ncbi:hypothetical protein BGY98DRAFT_957064 [Russula aff. rugulosa BPL654]|nr:hypothetical protein BGY98DRAFT_957064 [Russula aff. rugulosa BPL654]